MRARGEIRKLLQRFGCRSLMVTAMWCTDSVVTWPADSAPAAPRRTAPAHRKYRSEQAEQQTEQNTPGLEGINAGVDLAGALALFDQRPEALLHSAIEATWLLREPA